MKQYILIYTLLALTLVGCKDIGLDNGYDPSLEEKENSISFTSSIEETKATVTDITSLEKYGKFNICTFVEDDNKTDYFTTDVEYKDNIWEYEGTYYWPVRPLTFYGYTPLEADNIDKIEIKNNTSYSNYSLTYTSPSNVDEQIDLLVKSLKNTSKPASSANVDLEFEHALSCLKFQVKFEDEKNVTLNSININYVNIEKQRTYNFEQERWLEPTTSLDKVCFKEESELKTVITPLNENKTQTTQDPSNNPIIFTAQEIGNQLMIIPQPISTDENSSQYISIQVAYNILSADGSIIEVQTGVMPLPAPIINGSAQNSYNKGDMYTYKLVINGEKIIFANAEIEDEDSPLPAYGNIDLALITKATNPSDIPECTTPPDGASNAQYYYTTALRVQKLLEDGVTDFVVVGDLEAGNSIESYQGNGKLGYYGGWSSPFSLGASFAEANRTDGKEYNFSVDLRGVSGNPEFQYANTDESGASTYSDIKPQDRILMPGLFYGVSRLSEVILPHDIKAIGHHSFANCDGLTTIDIAEVLHIEEGAFQYSDKLAIVENGLLSRVHTNAFKGCTELKTIDLSNVTEVDDYGFGGCSSLTNVNLGKLDIIGKNAFDGCTSLTLQRGVEIPNFNSVADYAFSKCASLCTNGSHINLTEATSVGIHAFHTCSELLLSSGELNVLKTIGEGAFANCTKIASHFNVNLPAIESIGISAFENCVNLNITSGLERLSKIERSSFQDCKNLTGVDNLIRLTSAESVENLAFNGAGIVEVEFSTLKSVGDYAFDDCVSLTKITGLDNVESVGALAFAGCTLLEELLLPALKDGKWGAEFFANCTSLKTISIPQITIPQIEYINEGASVNSNVIQSLTIASTIESVNFESLITNISFEDVFSNKISLKSINFAAATGVGNNVFNGCASLSNINLSSATAIGNSTFENCTSLETISLPAALTLGDNTFKGCTLLNSVDLPLVTSMGGNPFRNCTSLVNISLPSLKGNFGEWGYFKLVDESYNFHPNTTLRTISLPLVTNVIASTFVDCSTLESVDLSSAIAIGENAFENCIELKNLYAKNAVTIGPWVLSGCSALEELILTSYTGSTDGSIGGTAGNSIGGWGYIKNNFPNLEKIDLSTVQTIISGTFVDHTNIKSINLSSATSIGEQTFNGCTNLTDIDLSGIKGELPTHVNSWDYPFSSATTTNCTLTLNSDQKSNVTNGNEWYNKTWKEIKYITK